MDFEVSAELVGIYLEDARSHLNVLDQGLLRLEREGVKADVIAKVLGPLHTLKGNSGMMGFASIKEYVHVLEDVLGHLRDRSLAASPALFDRLFAGASALRDAVERACARGKEERDLSPEREALTERDHVPERDHRIEQISPAPELTSQAGPGPADSVGATPAKPTGPAPSGQLPTSPAATPQKPTLTVPPDIVTTRSNLVRVDFAKLDHLLNLVGELIVQ